MAINLKQLMQNISKTFVIKSLQVLNHILICIIFKTTGFKIEQCGVVQRQNSKNLWIQMFLFEKLCCVRLFMYKNTWLKKMDSLCL